MNSPQRRFLAAAAAIVMGAGLIAACAPAAPAPAATAKPAAPAPTTAPAAPTTAPAAPTAAPTRPAATPTQPASASVGAGTLTAAKAAAAPKLDGDPGDAEWAKAQPLSIKVAGGQNLPNGSSDVTLKALYTADSVFFLAQWTDPTESYRRAPWQKQADGSWKQLKDGQPGDDNKYYEDKFAMIWSINDSIKGFDQQGCMATCHLGEGKPFGNKYTASEGELGDIWHWKGVRTGPVGQIDDQYLDHTRYDKEKSPEAGRKSDAKTGGGYVDNVTEDKKMPRFALPNNKPAPPYWILDSEKVAFDDSKYKPNDEVPGIIVAPFAGDRGDLKAAHSYKDGKWTLEWGRKLDTGSKTDVQFTDLARSYPFGVAVFDNSQVRHAFQTGASRLAFAR